jgi:uncharacterized DUF497 family protein
MHSGRRYSDAGLALVDQLRIVCTYTMRGQTYRLISVRKASKHEQRIWLQWK